MEGSRGRLDSPAKYNSGYRTSEGTFDVKVTKLPKGVAAKLCFENHFLSISVKFCVSKCPLK